MVHTVGIFGINGNVGAPTAKLLIKAAEEGKINVVIFHRENTDLSALSKGANVEFRILNIDDAPEKIAETVKGVNVFISALGFGALPSEPNLVEGLAKSKDLVTYVPSVYSTTWDEHDEKDPQLGPVLAFLHAGWKKAKELGVGVTPIYTGVFDLYWFVVGFVGSPIKENTVWANEDQLKNRIPIVASQHLAQALTRIATSSPQEIRNKEYSVVTFWPTGQEIVDLYTKINGKPATVKDFTKEDYEAQMADGANFGPAKAGYWDRWAKNKWSYEEGGKVVDREYEGPSLEEFARQYAAQ